MTKIINKTPHVIRIRLDENKVVEALENDIVIEPTLPAARVASTSVVAGEVNGIPIKKTVFGEIYDLPETDNPNAKDISEHETVYVVSMVVAQAAKSRTDIIGPNTGPGQDIRYPEGHPQKGMTFAVRGFQVF